MPTVPGRRAGVAVWMIVASGPVSSPACLLLTWSISSTRLACWAVSWASADASALPDVDVGDSPLSRARVFSISAFDRGQAALQRRLALGRAPGPRHCSGSSPRSSGSHLGLGDRLGQRLGPFGAVRRCARTWMTSSVGALISTVFLHGRGSTSAESTARPAGPEHHVAAGDLHLGGGVPRRRLPAVALDGRQQHQALGWSTAAAPGRERRRRRPRRAWPRGPAGCPVRRTVAKTRPQVDRLLSHGDHRPTAHRVSALQGGLGRGPVWRRGERQRRSEARAGRRPRRSRPAS